MSDPRPFRKSALVVPFVIAGLLVAGVSAWWFAGRARIDEGLEREAAALRERGYEVEWTSRRIGGFPFRYYVEMEGARIAEPGGHALSAPKLEAEAAIYRPDIVVLVAPEGLTLTRPGGATYDIEGRILRMSLGGLGQGTPRVSVEGGDMSIRGAQGGEVLFPTIGRVVFQLRPSQGDRASVLLAVTGARPAEGSLAAPIAGDEGVSFGIRGEISHAGALKGDGWPSLVRNWAGAGGVFEIAEGGIAAGEARIDLEPSRLSAGPDGRAAGEVSFTAGRASEAMLVAGEVGALPDETAAVAAGLAIAGVPGRFTFREGRTYLGPLPIGSAPRLY